MSRIKCVICNSTPREYRDVRNNPEYHDSITRFRVQNGVLTPLEVNKPIVLCIGCFRIVQDVLQHPQSMSVTDLLRNTNEEAQNPTATPIRDSLTTVDDTESMFDDASASDLSHIPPSSESVNALVPQTSESPTIDSLPASLEVIQVLIPSQTSPAVREACKRVMNAPGPKSKKRRRVLELLNNLEPGDTAHSQQMLEFLESQNEDPIDMQRFWKKATKKIKPAVKRPRVRLGADSSSDSGRVDASQSSQSQIFHSHSISLTTNEPGPSIAGPSRAVAEPAKVVAPPRAVPPAAKTPKVVIPSRAAPPAAQPPPQAASIPSSLSSSTSSSANSSPAMRPPSQPVLGNAANPHSNMAAPRRIDFNYAVPSSSNIRSVRNFNSKNLGG